ncbi:MAG: translation elongation factor Ts, partial [Bacillota bacterium]|nr:translation elongation factor Ts [Bacillota bacterium]
MAAVTAAMVKDLRETSGAGMMDCKKALVACDGDMEKAIDYLRENGLAKAAKKSGRIAAEGLVQLAFNADGTKAAAVEVNAETDFVAKNEEFVKFVDDCAQLALQAECDCMDKFMDMQMAEGTVKDVLTAKIAKIGENMNVRR